MLPRLSSNFLPQPNGNPQKGKCQVRKGDGPDAALAKKVRGIWDICKKYLLAGHTVPNSEVMLRTEIEVWFKGLPPTAKKDITTTNIEHYLKFIVDEPLEPWWFFIRDPRTLYVKMAMLYIHRDIIKERVIRGAAPQQEETLHLYTLCRTLHFPGRMQWASRLWSCYERLGMQLSEYRKICNYLDLAVVEKDFGLEYMDLCTETMGGKLAASKPIKSNHESESVINIGFWNDVEELNQEWDNLAQTV